MRYKEYLQTDVWLGKRTMVMNRAQGECEAKLIDICTVEATEVHHDDYRYTGEEPLWVLRAVCRPCHERITEIDRKHGRIGKGKQ